MRFPLFLTLMFLSGPSLLFAASGPSPEETSYLHPVAENFTDFKFVSPLPKSFVRAYPRRAEMGNQYLDFMGVIAIVGETKAQRADMRRIAIVLMGLIDNDQDGQLDDVSMWKKRRKEIEPQHPLVLYVTRRKEKYKSFDNASPTLYHQGWSSVRDGQALRLSNIQEELFHFLQRHLWEHEYPNEFGLDRRPPGIVEAAASNAVRNRHYVYDQDCIIDKGCLVPEFFFCVMTTLMGGWEGEGFEAPGRSEWRLKGDVASIRKNYPAMTKMIEKMQQEGKLPRKWPSFFLPE